MDLGILKKTLYNFYTREIDGMADEFCKKMFRILDEKDTGKLTGYERKALQYTEITENVSPILFPCSPFYHELGTMQALCDGAGDFHGRLHAGGWNYDRYSKLFWEQDEKLAKQRWAQGDELLYLICGPYCDTRQHFIFNVRPVLSGGLLSLYNKAEKCLESAKTEEEKQFFKASLTGLLCLKKISEKFSEKAKKMLDAEKSPDGAANLSRIAESAARTPWEAPKTFYEALNTLAFLRTVCGALEGVGYNTFGRPDLDLYPFYKKDTESGVMTKEEAFDMISAFLITWDSHYDHHMKMTGYVDHELENTYVLGGCDADGNQVYNELTEMFFEANSERDIIFPKIKARISKASPGEYLRKASEDVIKGCSTLLYSNDDATIPALVRSGVSLEDARDYLITGCWGLETYGNHMDDHGNYVNLLKAFEFSVHDRKDLMEKCGLYFEPLDGAESFEEVYSVTLENCRRLFRERNRMTLAGKGIWHRIDPLPLTSASMDNCLENAKDLTNGGCKYHNEEYECVGFPNIIDSLLAIKELCFDKKICSLPELLSAVRGNWEGNEHLMTAARKCHGWGDGSDETKELSSRFHHDLYLETEKLKTLWDGGKVRLGHVTYTEIRFWGERTLATPDGRRNGEYFSQGLTPSRLHEIKSVTSVIESLAAIDASEIAASSVVNIILPPKNMTPEICEGFLRASCESALMCLQLNVVSKEELLDAMVHPENHERLVVRVCGFSVLFTSLTPEWQAEFISRNFYE